MMVWDLMDRLRKDNPLIPFKGPARNYPRDSYSHIGDSRYFHGKKYIKDFPTSSGSEAIKLRDKYNLLITYDPDKLETYGIWIPKDKVNSLPDRWWVLPWPGY